MRRRRYLVLSAAVAVGWIRIADCIPHQIVSFQCCEAASPTARLPVLLLLVPVVVPKVKLPGMVLTPALEPPYQPHNGLDEKPQLPLSIHNYLDDGWWMT
jgi:hypothetical protein